MLRIIIVSLEVLLEKKYAVLFCRKSQFWSRLFGMSRTESGRSGKYNFFNTLTYVYILRCIFICLAIMNQLNMVLLTSAYRVCIGYVRVSSFLPTLHGRPICMGKPDIYIPLWYLINKVGYNYLSCLLSVINCQWGGNSLMYEIITAVEVELFIAERLIL